MAVTMICRRLGGRSFEFFFTSTLDNPLYRIFVDGVRVAVQRSGRFLHTVPPDAHSDVQVLDEAGVTPDSAQSFPRLSWPPVANTGSYRVEQYIDGEWRTRQRILDDGRDGYKWQSPMIIAGAEQQYRVTPVGADGNDGTPVTPAVTIAALPAPPVVDMTYDNETHKVTLTEA
ncbi:MAG: hypothetical protein AMJ84_04860 [Acidithiobacillales bacterium SM23_46]|nr:MAG: hypothetical protein AMJ84_04860 [Acidithiobacillales bacterium SM23_46]